MKMEAPMEQHNLGGTNHAVGTAYENLPYLDLVSVLQLPGIYPHRVYA